MIFAKNKINIFEKTIKRNLAELEIEPDKNVKHLANCLLKIAENKMYTNSLNNQLDDIILKTIASSIHNVEKVRPVFTNNSDFESERSRQHETTSKDKIGLKVPWKQYQFLENLAGEPIASTDDKFYLELQLKRFFSRNDECRKLCTKIIQIE